MRKTKEDVPGERTYCGQDLHNKWTIEILFSQCEHLEPQAQRIPWQPEPLLWIRGKVSRAQHRLSDCQEIRRLPEATAQKGQSCARCGLWSADRRCNKMGQLSDSIECGKNYHNARTHLEFTSLQRHGAGIHALADARNVWQETARGRYTRNNYGKRVVPVRRYPKPIHSYDRWSNIRVLWAVLRYPKCEPAGRTRRAEWLSYPPDYKRGTGGSHQRYQPEWVFVRAQGILQKILAIIPSKFQSMGWVIWMLSALTERRNSHDRSRTLEPAYSGILS